MIYSCAKIYANRERLIRYFFYRGNTVRLIGIHKSICDLFSVYLSGQWINDVHMSEPTEKYGINLIMSKAVATRIQPSHDISLFDYTAEFNFTEDHNGNGKGVVNILKSGIPCALRYGDWVIHPSVKFFFSWSGQNYCFDAVSSNFASADFRKIKTYNFQKS